MERAAGRDAVGGGTVTVPGHQAVAATAAVAGTGHGRLLGVDAARGIALLGMMVTHLVPEYGELGGANPAFTLFDGRASALFAVVAGMSLALADGGSRHNPTTEQRPWSRPFGVMLLRIVVRAVLIGALGMVLALTDPPILIILTYYALLFVLLAPLLRLPAVVLGVLGLVWAVGAPVLSHLIRRTYGWDVELDQPSFAALASEPAMLARELLLTGAYPAGTWLAYALIGAALGRAVLTPQRLAVLAGAGLALAVGAQLVSMALLRTGADLLRADVSGYTLEGRFYGTTPSSSWWWLAIARPHSGTPLDLLATIGSAVLVIAVMILLFRTSARLAVGWLALVGSMTLTLYSAHGLAASRGLPAGLSPETTWLVHAVAAAVIALVWRGWFRRGPLEAVVAGAVTAVTPPSARRPDAHPATREPSDTSAAA